LLVYSGGGTVDFQEFVGGLSAFSSRGGRDEKLRCTSGRVLSPKNDPAENAFVSSVAFKVYDMDRDGFISNGELFLVLKMMVGNNLKVGSVTLCSLYSSTHTNDSSTCRIRNSKKLWTRRSWRRIRTAMES